MTSRKTPWPRCLRHAFISAAALGLLGAAAQANATVRLEREALEARVDAARAALLVADARGHATAGPRPILLAQWNNFKNWNNWNNWKKWLNQ